MKNYAVVRIKGSQYKVSEGDEILVGGSPSKDYESEVLLKVTEGKATVGKPVVKDAKLNFKILEEVRGEKIYVSKYKAKSRYRKRIGFRSTSTKLRIEKIG